MCAANSRTRRTSRAAGFRATAISCSASPRAREFRSTRASRASARAGGFAGLVTETRREHHHRGGDERAIVLPRRHLVERRDMRDGGFLGARAAPSETVGVEHRVDQAIWIVVGFGQRVARGAPPEL